MTAVAFHFNAPDRLNYACRLLRKAYHQGARMVVLTDATLADTLDKELWTMAGTAFVPHCAQSAPPFVRNRSAIMICSEAEVPETKATVLINLRDSVPVGFEGFDRVIEVVTTEPEVRALARERWKTYRAAGFEPEQLDLQKMRAGP